MHSIVLEWPKFKQPKLKFDYQWLEKLLNDWTRAMMMLILSFKEDFRDLKVSVYVTMTHLHFRRHRCLQQHSHGMLTPGSQK